jgi:hypothetical protein
VVGEVDHRLEDSADRSGTHLVAQARGEQGARGGARTAGAFGDVVEEAIIVVAGTGEDLPAQEAVFGGEVAFDIGEAQDTVWFLVRQQQRGQAAHRMPDQMETPDACVVQESLRRFDQERDRDARQILTEGLAASRCVVGEERAPGERALACDVEVVLLRRAEAVQEDDGGQVAVPAGCGDRQAHVANTQVHLLVPDIGGCWCCVRHGCLACRVW